MKHTLLVLSTILLIVLNGCTTLGGVERTSRANVLQEAQVLAISWMFEETMDLNESQLGLIAFEGLEPSVLQRLREKYGDLVPELTLDVKRINQNTYTDTHTQRHAMIVRVRVTVFTNEKVTLRIGKHFGLLGAAEYDCMLENRDGKWQVVDWELGIVS